MVENLETETLPDAQCAREALTSQNARLAALQEVVLDLTSNLDLSDVLQRVAEIAQTLSVAAHAHIFLYDRESDKVNLAASHWSSDQRIVPLQPRRTGITHSVALGGKSQFIEDTTNHPAYAEVPSDLKPGAVACLPLMKADHILGTLNLGYWEPHWFDADTRNFLDLMARYAAIAIENARLYADAKRQSKELERRVQELVVINDFSRCVNTLNLDQMLRCGLELMVANFQAAYCSLSLYDSVTHAVTVRAVEPRTDTALGRVFNVETNPFLADAMRWQRPMVWRDDRHAASDDPLTIHLRARGTTTMVITPLIVKDQVMGFVAVEPGAQELGPTQLTLLQTIGNQLAVAIENARLHEIAIEKASMERELQVARELQSSLIPRQTPQIAGWEFAALSQPARIVSGDFYDFIQIAEPPRLGILIADVSDKGMPAALFMALARSTLRGSITPARSPAECIAQANRLLCADTANGMFVTLFYAQLDPTTGELVYVNAGHNPPLLYRKERDQLIELTRTGIALGVDDTHGWMQRAVKLDHGDFVLFFTDGVTEAADAQQQEFGKECLRQVLLYKRRAPAAEIVAALDQALGDFVGLTPRSDDVTVVVVKRL
jgi:serine phosphatase RsbU (regulator of sigma subunit)